MKRKLGIARCGPAWWLCPENLFIKKYGIEELLDYLERNEKNGDYDDFDDVEKLIWFIKSGIK